MNPSLPYCSEPGAAVDGNATTSMGGTLPRSMWASPAGASVALALGLLLLAAATYWSAREIVARSVRHRLEATATFRARTAATWIEDIRNDIKVWTASPHFFRAMEDWRSGGPRDPAARQRLLEFLALLSKTSQYADVGVRDATNGALLLTTRDEVDSAAERDEAKLAVEASSPLFEVMHRHSPDGRSEPSYLDYFAAVTLPRSGEKLVMGIDIDLRHELIPLVEHRTDEDDGDGKSAEVRLMRREGDAMVVLNEKDGGHRGRTTALASAGARGRVDAELVRGAVGFLRGDDDRGEPVLAFAQPVAGTSWILVASVTEAEAFAELNKFALLVAAFAGTLLLLATWWWGELRRHLALEKRHQVERAEQGQRLAELSRRVVSVQEEERRRLASELHDRTGANLATININLKSIARGAPAHGPDGEALMEETRELLADTIVSIREFCGDLRPSILDYAGLQQAIENCVDRFTRRTGVRGDVDHAEFVGRCPPEVESVLFRIVQEALLNCAKHAQARTVRVRLRGDSRHLLLTIEDDGVGFDPQALGLPGSNTGSGLLNMRERAAFAGGSFSIESAPGRGTRIRIEI